MRVDDQLAGVSAAWFDSVSHDGVHVQLDDSEIGASGAIDIAQSWLTECCLPELADATQLGGCTVADVRRVLASLYVHSLYVAKLEDVADDQSLSLPSHVFSRSRANTIEWLSTLSGVSTSAVGTIVDILTFDVSHPHVTAAHQPFVPSQSGQLCLLPRMLQFLDLPKMYVAALNKTKLGKSDYSHAINTIEDVGVSAIAADIRAACVLPSAEQPLSETWHLCG